MRLICPCPFGYGAQSRYYTNRETGLILTTYRYYDPKEGRFLNRDPIGYAGGMNLYAYCGGNPVGRLDPSGLWWDGEDWGNFRDRMSLGTVESYLGDVGQVFAGYGDNLNPVNWYNGASYLFDIASNKGMGAAGGALLNGIGHSLTAWATTGDPREFGQSFGTVLTTAASVAAPFADGLMPVYRVYGGESGPFGDSWTFIDPVTCLASASSQVFRKGIQAGSS